MRTSFHDHRQRSSLRLFAAVLLLAALGVIAALWAGHASGRYSLFFVVSGSMEPAIQTGDAIIVTAEDPQAIKVGDVITYTAPIRGNPTVTHRVTAIAPYSRTYPIVHTKGDANAAEDYWDVHLQGEKIWKQQATIPSGTLVTTQALQPGLLALVFSFLALSFFVIAMRVLPRGDGGQSK